MKVSKFKASVFPSIPGKEKSVKGVLAHALSWGAGVCLPWVFLMDLCIGRVGNGWWWCGGGTHSRHKLTSPRGSYWRPAAQPTFSISMTKVCGRMQYDRGKAQNESTTLLFHTVSAGVRPPKCSGFQNALTRVFAFPCEMYCFNGKHLKKKSAKMKNCTFCQRSDGFKLGLHYISWPFLALHSVPESNIQFLLRPIYQPQSSVKTFFPLTTIKPSTLWKSLWSWFTPLWKGRSHPSLGIIKWIMTPLPCSCIMLMFSIWAAFIGCHTKDRAGRRWLSRDWALSSTTDAQSKRHEMRRTVCVSLCSVRTTLAM